MPFDELLADRIRRYLEGKHIPFDEKKMFGGLCYLVDDKMTVGITGEKLMVRIDPADEQAALARKGAGLMDFTGKSMRGFLYIQPEGYDLDKDLEMWIDECLAFNPKAKSSKKKKG